MNIDLKRALWCDLKTDADRAAWLRIGRGYETGIMSSLIEEKIAQAYERLEKINNEELFTRGANVGKALDIAVKYGGVYGDRNKAWVIDQMVRALTGDRYLYFVADANFGNEGPNTYEWDTGAAPGVNKQDGTK